MRLPERVIIGAGLAEPRLAQRLFDLLQPIVTKLNQVAAGTLAGFDATGTAAPTTGTYAQGDKVWHSAPVEAGTAGSKYVVIGWVCVAGGTPGTWVAMRCLTGN